MILANCLGAGNDLNTCGNIFLEYSAQWETSCGPDGEVSASECDNFMAQWGYYHYPAIFRVVTIVDTCKLDASTCPPKHYCEEDDKAINIWLPNGANGVNFCKQLDTICLNGHMDDPSLSAQCEAQWHAFSWSYDSQCPHYISFLMEDACTMNLWENLELYYFKIFTYITSTSVTTHTHITPPPTPPQPSTDFCGEEINSLITYLPVGVTAAEFCDTVSSVIL